jgi:hypothetical protein
MRFGIDGKATMCGSDGSPPVRGKFHVTASKTNGLHDAKGYFVWSGSPAAVQSGREYELQESNGKCHAVMVHNASVNSGPNIVVCTAYFYSLNPTEWFAQEVQR